MQIGFNIMAVLPRLPMHDNIEPPTDVIEVVSTKSLASVSHHLRGVDVPVNTRKPFTKLEREMWLNVIELLLAKGVESSGKVASITGLNATQVSHFQKEILKRWQTGIAPSTVNYRREKLYFEADRVKDACWRLFERAEHENRDYKEQVIFLKMIIDAGARQAKLCGLDNIELVQDQKSEKIHSKQLKLPADTLDKIGQLLAQEISNNDK